MLHIYTYLYGYAGGVTLEEGIQVLLHRGDIFLIRRQQQVVAAIFPRLIQCGQGSAVARTAGKVLHVVDRHKPVSTMPYERVGDSGASINFILFKRQSHLESVIVGWLVVLYVSSTARSFRDGTPIYCPLRRL